MIARRRSAVLILLSVPSNAVAHESRPAYLQLTETQPGRFAVLWKVPQRGELRLGLQPRWPQSCAPPQLSEASWTDAALQRGALQCPTGLVGERIVIDGLATTMTDVLARIEWLDGRVQTNLVHPSAPWFNVEGRRAKLRVAGEYAVLGVGHILGGVDHLMFVLGLLLIVRGTALLIKTVTAFTLAHSVTLGLAALGAVRLPSAPVEAVIALSILFLGRELLCQQRGEESLTARYPWLVALSFGLLHGFGFAGALAEVGLPQGDIPLALLCFNLGVEAGQLVFVALVLLAMAVIQQLRLPLPRWATVVPPYAIGSVAMFWVIQRLSAF